MCASLRLCAPLITTSRTHCQQHDNNHNPDPNCAGRGSAAAITGEGEAAAASCRSAATPRVCCRGARRGSRRRPVAGSGCRAATRWQPASINTRRTPPARIVIPAAMAMADARGSAFNQPQRCNPRAVRRREGAVAQREADHLVQRSLFLHPERVTASACPRHRNH